MTEERVVAASDIETDVDALNASIATFTEKNIDY
jgi:hypothetical protein